MQQKNNLKCRIIKTTNIACEFIITSNRIFSKIGEEETKRYFQVAYNFVANYKNLGEQYIYCLQKFIWTESTTHLHIVFIPAIHTKDKSGNKIEKIACSEYWKR